MLSKLYDLYAETAATEDERMLPPHVTVLDSAPAAAWEYNKIIAALEPGFPRGVAGRLIAMPLAHLLAMWKTGSIKLLGWPDDLTAWGKSHNDKSRVSELRRVYCYSNVDAIVPVLDVEAHATEAETNGFEVRRELFKDSSHVSHMRSDPDRYWRIVEETWRGRAKL